VAQRVGRGIALLFHDRGTRRGWGVSSTPRPHFTPGKDPVPILHEAGWAPGPVCKGGKSRPHRDSIPDRPARSQSLYRLSYRAHICNTYVCMYVRMYVKRTGQCQDVFDINHILPSTRLLLWMCERNTTKLHVQVFLIMNTWMFETCRRYYN